MSAKTELKDFVLLSKIAKEKKYAQEYLGLLARRGDMGSIRIGKRWYTTVEWFDEFLADAEKRKEEAKAQLADQAIELKKIIAPAEKIKPIILRQKEEKIEVHVAEVKKEAPAEAEQPALAEKVEEEKVAVKFAPRISEIKAEETKPAEAEQRLKLRIEVKKPEAEKIKIEERVQVEIPVKAASKKISPPMFLNYSAQKVPVFVERPVIKIQNSSANLEIRKKINPPQAIPKEKMGMPVFVPRFNQYQYARNPVFSSNDGKVEKENPIRNPFFTFGAKLAFSSVFLLLLAVLSGGIYLYKKDTNSFFFSGGGKVAGAEDTKLAGMSSISDAASSYVDSQNGQMKENVSFSRVILEAALEKGQVSSK